MPANPPPPLTPAQQAAQIEAQARLLEAQNRLRTAQAAALKLDNASASPPPPPASKLPTKSQWAQDNVARPYNSANAHRNSFFASMNRAQTSYVMKYTATAAGGVFTSTFTVELDRNFWFCGLVTAGYAVATQIGGNRAGWLNVRDNQTNNMLMTNTHLNILFAVGSGQRIIWPMAYPIGAGGSFNMEVTVDALAGVPDTDIEVKAEGFWDFTHV